MSRGIHIILGDRFVQPSQDDIILKIDYLPDDSSPARVFEIAANLIRAFEDLDRVLIGSVDSKIATELVLEDLQKSSIKIWLKNRLKSVDDQALKDFDWKKLVGSYLLKGKYAAIEWLDRGNSDSNPAKIEDLTERLHQLAIETDVRHLPDYPPINPARLAQPLDSIQRTKGMFREGEKLTITLQEADYEVHLDEQWLPSEHLPSEPAEQELSNTADMVFVIRKADFLGKSQWQFKHGKAAISAAIEDEEWLNDFHRGHHPIVPGDALRVRAQFDYKYDAKGDLIDQKVTITHVYGVLHPSAPSRELFHEGE